MNHLKCQGLSQRPKGPVTTLWRGLSQHPRTGKYSNGTGLLLYEA
ncbi:MULTISPECIES: hypothetical protein [unclassified Bartonella]